MEEKKWQEKEKEEKEKRQRLPFRLSRHPFSSSLSFLCLLLLFSSLSLLVRIGECAGQNARNEGEGNKKEGEEGGGDELLLVQAVWRHGDRYPTATYANDPNQEEKWPQGWGQLTPKGMGQQVVLGDRLAQKYIRDLHFVNARYKSGEVYVRSTDLNRTLTSAIANMIGFYKAGEAGEDFPGGKDAPSPWWPSGFTPVAVHTLSNHEDRLLPEVTEAPCLRQVELHKLMKTTPEYEKLMSEKKWLFDTLTKLCGQQIDISNIGMIHDTLFIEDNYKEKLKLEIPVWVGNETLREGIRNVSFLLDEWNNGRGLDPLKGVNFEVEFPRIRGGPILWLLIENLQAKVQCAKPDADKNRTPRAVQKRSPTGSPICQWMSPKKYFAYSAHDTTIAALFSALGFPKTNYNEEGFPHYTACVTIELWSNSSRGGEPYIKVFYWPPDKNVIEVTSSITGCENDCTLEKFAARSELYRPQPSPEAYCQNTKFESEGSGALKNSSGSSLFAALTLLLFLCWWQ